MTQTPGEGRPATLPQSETESSTQSRSWDAASYDRVSVPQQQWAAPVVDRLELTGGERVLDAGCGTGRVTEVLLGLVPHGSVVGVDADPDMVRVARERFGDRAEIVQQSLDELELDEPVDAIFSNATFHWILDHDKLFRALARACRPGARLSAQCGGDGNIAHVKSIADRLYPGEVPRIWRYATPEDTAVRLAAAGFTEVQTWLEPQPTTPPEPLVFMDVILGPYVQRMPEPDRTPFKQAVLDELGDPPVLDYVRLNMVARYPA
jgi:trans-aconitate 2-methyltransferase